MLSEIQAVREEVRAFDRSLRDLRSERAEMSRIPSAALDAHFVDVSPEEETEG